MKQKDIALVIMVAGLSAIVAFVISNLFITSPKNRSQRVEVVEPITYEFNAPPTTKYFNTNSINPTKIIRIGDDANPDPFAGE